MKVIFNLFIWVILSSLPALSNEIDTLWMNTLDDERPYLEDVNDIDHSLDGKYIAIAWTHESGLGLAKPRIYDAESGTFTKEFDGLRSYYNSCVCFSPNSQYLVSGGNLATAVAWEIDSGNIYREFVCDTTDDTTNYTVNDVGFSPSGDTLVVIYSPRSGNEKKIIFWDFNTGNILYEEEIVKIGYNLEYSSHGDKILFWSRYSYTIYGIGGKLPGEEYSHHDTEIRDARFSPDADYIISGEELFKVKVMDIQTENIVTDIDAYVNFKKIFQNLILPNDDLLIVIRDPVNDLSIFYIYNNSSEYIAEFDFKARNIKVSPDEESLYGYNGNLFKVQLNYTPSIVEPGDREKESNIYPNPGNQKVTIPLTDSTIQKITIRVLNINGGLVKSWDLENKQNNVELDISDIQPGAYSLLIDTGKKIINKKLLIER